MNDKIKQQMDKVISVVAGDMATIRAGGAKPSMVEGISVEAYGGSRMKLSEVASITAPDPTQIIINPWDKSLIRAIEKGIMESELGLMPSTSGDFIRIVIPALTEERRRDFVKLVRQKMESGRVMLRSARQELKDDIEKTKGQPGVSEDDVDRELAGLDKITNEYMEKLEKLADDKESEIMKV
jgi:ribosome recycling factor